MSTEEWVNKILDAWNENHIRFVVMRGHEGLPSFIDNDLDILFDPRCCKQAEEIFVQTVESLGGRIHNRVPFGAVCLYFYDPETLEQYHFDFYERLEWRGFDFLPAEEVLQQAQLRKNYYIPSKLHEVVLCLLTRLLYGGYVNRKYSEKVSQFVLKEPDVFLGTLSVCFGRKLARKMSDAVLREQWDAIDKLSGSLRFSLMRRQLMRRPIHTARSLMSDLRRLVLRWRRLPGLVVRVNADSVDYMMVEHFMNGRELLNKSFYPQISAIVLKQPNEKIPVDISNENPTCMVVPGSFVKRGVFWFKIRKRLFQNALVILCSEEGIPASWIERFMLNPSQYAALEYHYESASGSAEFTRQVLAHQSQRIADDEVVL